MEFLIFPFTFQATLHAEPPAERLCPFIGINSKAKMLMPQLDNLKLENRQRATVYKVMSMFTRCLPLPLKGRYVKVLLPRCRLTFAAPELPKAKAGAPRGIGAPGFTQLWGTLRTTRMQIHRSYGGWKKSCITKTMVETLQMG
jgi:hypothetical protein